jgi:hypothetical protein
MGLQGAAPRGGETRQRGVFFDGMDQHGTDATALGCSDNGGWHMPRGRGCDRGGRRGAVTRARVADRRDRVTPRPGGSGWVWVGARASEVARRGALVGRPGSTVPAGLVFNRFKPVPTDSNLSKLCLIQKVSSRAPKIRNKIWLERS